MTGPVIIIPARYASVRFPGKALALLRGADGVEKSLVRRTWDAAMAVPGIAGVWVATDDARIAEHVTGFGGQAVMTPESCANGTERCAAAIAALRITPSIVVNLQGDAPLTPPWFVSALIGALEAHTEVDLATPVLRCSPEALAALEADRRAGRVGGTTAVFRRDHEALYFSKEVLPFAGGDRPVYHHVGVYAYRPGVLQDYAHWPVGPLEQAEGLEQLRFLENGRRVICVEVEARGRSFWEVNNPEDIPLVERALA